MSFFGVPIFRDELAVSFRGEGIGDESVNLHTFEQIKDDQPNIHGIFEMKS